MRVGIDFRILTVGPSAATRGMPRYTQQQLREVLAAGSDDDYVLVCDPRADQSLILPEVRAAPNVTVRLVPEAVTVNVHDDATLLAKAEMFESWLAQQRLDVYHATTPFYLDQLLVADHDSSPYVATVYDLIPLIYPSQYLATPKLRQLYMLAAAMVSRATRLVAISEAARRDASRYLGFPEDRIDVASPIAEPFFRPVPHGASDAGVRDLRARRRVPESFVLSVADLHFTKNLETLLRAYALLPGPIRARLSLVVACHLSPEHEEYLAGLAAKLGVGGQVVTTGLVSDRELVSLYNSARFLVHPSRYEGFGLPVLEAMQCGCPVIASRSSSLPEVAADAAILVDPDDAPGFAEAMRLLEEDPAQREEMRERGLARAASYRGDALAAATLASYAAAARPAVAPERPRLAMWSPLPPLQSGVADYTADLVGQLEVGCDVELFVDDGYLPSLDILLTHRVRHFSAFDRMAARFDAVVYQLGASVFHLYMEGPMQRYPGVVVLHDLVWSHVLHHRWAERGDIDGFRRHLCELEGEEAVAEYDGLDRDDHRDRAERLGVFLDRHLMLAQVVRRSPTQIVHFPTAVDELARRYPCSRGVYVPMGVADPSKDRPGLHSARARAQLGIDPATFVVGVFGIVDDVKRVDACVTALAEVVRLHPDTVLFVVGPALDRDYRDRLVEQARALDVLGGLRITGYLPADEFDDHLAACDVVVNLRFPSRMQMSATVLRAAAAGKPVIITDLPEWDFLPSTFCQRIPSGEPEASTLARHLVALAADAPLRSELSVAARSYYRAESTLARMAAGYFEVLERICAPPGDGRWPPHETEAPAPGQRSRPQVNLNKVCEIEDFADPDLAAVMRDVFSYKLDRVPPGYPTGAEYRKDWEIAMAVRALREGGAVHPGAVILGVGAGTEDTNFYLTRHVARVVATDRYLSAGEWSDVAPSAMLLDPTRVAPYDFDQGRLVVQHMDGRRLRFEDATFDGVYSSGSIEHFGDLEDIASAAYEMGRVLKPGGVLSLSTEILLSGPPGGRGIPGTLLLSPADLRRYIIEASGLEPVDELRLEVSQPTLTTQRDLARAIRGREERIGGDHGRKSWLGDPGLELPHLVVVSDGYVFTSVHLALRKCERYPVAANEWARPSAGVLLAIEEDNRRLLSFRRAMNARSARLIDHMGTENALMPATVPASWVEMEASAGRLARAARLRSEALAEGRSRLIATHAVVDTEVVQTRSEEELAAACYVKIDDVLLGVAARRESLPGPAQDEGATALRESYTYGHGTGWRWCPIELPGGRRVGVMVDPETCDPSGTSIVTGGGYLDWTAAELLVAMVRPGDIVLDIGAGLGAVSLAAAAAGCRVVAVEASRVSAALLRASVARNGFDGVEVINAEPGDAPSASDAPHPPEPVVPVVAIDALLEALQIPAVAWVHLDGGGLEVPALRGMIGLLAREAPPLVFSSGDDALRSQAAEPVDLVVEMEKLGYEIFLVDPGHRSRVPPGQAQVQPVYLAVRGPLDRLQGWRVEGPPSPHERISRLVQEPAATGADEVPEPAR